MQFQHPILSLMPMQFEQSQETIALLIRIVESRDSYTAGHSERVARYAKEISALLGYSKTQQETLHHAGLLHDIGKIITPESILLKPEALTHEEYLLMQDHATTGESIVATVTALHPLLPAIRHHHERYDGTGYPDGLKGEKIPLDARILAVADAFDAMTTNRIYRPRKTISQAVDELHTLKHIQFDPHVVEAASRFFKTLEPIQSPAFSLLPDLETQGRFAYFFKDPLTGLFNSAFLNLSLQNMSKTAFHCCYHIELVGMHRHNQTHGWSAGNALLCEVAARLRALFAKAHLFRIHGDGFVVLHVKHTPLDIPKIQRQIVQGFDPLTCCIVHIDLKNHTVYSWEELEKLLP